jgi:hypothetical protein
MLNYLVPNTNLRRPWNQPRPVSPQPRSGPCYKVHMFFLIHTSKGRIPTLMSPGLIISIYFRPSYTWIIYFPTQIQGNNGTNQDRYHLNQAQDLAAKFLCSFRYILLKDGIQSLCLPASYLSISGHYMHNYIVPIWSENLRKKWNSPTRPGPCYKVYRFFLIHPIKGRNSSGHKS